MNSSFFHVAAIASAGTGKTYSLVENYLYALLGLDQSRCKKRPHEILALTFTEKAANEMRLRIARRVTELMSGSFPDDLKERLTCEGIDPPDKEMLRRILRALPNASITTFHSFCAQLLRREAKAFAIDDSFAILSPREERRLAHNVLRPIVIEEIVRDNRPLRSLVARLGLSANLSSLGLLDSLMEIYATLSEKNISCEQIVHLTARKVVTKHDLELRLEAIELAIQMFHQSKPTDKAKERLRQMAALMPALKSALDNNIEPSIANAFSDIKKSVSGNFGAMDARARLVNAVNDLGARLVEHFVHPEEVVLARLLLRFHEAFAAHKQQANVMSYADLLQKAKEGLMSDLALRKRTKDGIRHILVDEYQDTSPIQQDIIALLLEDRSVASIVPQFAPAIDQLSFANGSSLFVVGDKKQSIYGFRGADVSLFDQMIEKMEETHKDASSFDKRFLTINRRSKSRIIELVNLVARATLGNQGYDETQALSPLPEMSAGSCCLWVNQDDNDKDKTTANLSVAANGIAKLLAARTDVSERDIVVLVRRIKSATVVKQNLASLGISARIIGGDGFFEQQEIVDILCALKLINNPSDQFASAVVLRSPLVLLSDADMARILPDISLSTLAKAERGFFSDDVHARIDAFVSALEHAPSLAMREGLGAVLDLLIETSDLAYCYAQHKTADQKWANIKKLRTMLSLTKGNPFSAIDEFYDEIFQSSKEPQADAGCDQQAVTIMTIHQSKGLEFGVVVLADGESMLKASFGDLLVNDTHGLALRPKRRPIAGCAASQCEQPTRFIAMTQIERAQEKDEMARLLYVALTRAQREIYVACSQASFAKDADTLVGLFLRAHREWPDEFARLCEIVVVDKVQARVNDVAAQSRQVERAVYEKSATMQRWFASSFALSEDEGLSQLVKTPKAKPIFGVDGDLAHRMIAQAGNVALADASVTNLDDAIDASARSLGVMHDAHTQKTFTAVKKTLGFLIECEQPRWFMFEMPLWVYPDPYIMIEGFADLVMESEDYVSVIEFKSSLAKATDINSYAQVLTYAHALSLHSNKPVRFTVALVGTTSFDWQIYNERPRQIFLRAVKRQLGEF